MSNKSEMELIGLVDLCRSDLEPIHFFSTGRLTVGSQAVICEYILFHNLTVCIDTCICDLSFPKIAVLKVL